MPISVVDGNSTEVMSSEPKESITIQMISTIRATASTDASDDFHGSLGSHVWMLILVLLVFLVDIQAL